MIHRPAHSRRDDLEVGKPKAGTLNPTTQPPTGASSWDSASLSGTGTESREVDHHTAEKAKAVLAYERRGVSCRDILSAIDQQSWVLNQPLGARNLGLTLRICHLNEKLTTEYRTQGASESFSDRLLSAIPLAGGRVLPRERYLESISDVNELVTKLADAGLVCVVPTTTALTASGRAPGLVLNAPTVYGVMTTDLGKAILNSEL